MVFVALYLNLLPLVLTITTIHSSVCIKEFYTNKGERVIGKLKNGDSSYYNVGSPSAFNEEILTCTHLPFV